MAPDEATRINSRLDDQQEILEEIKTAIVGPLDGSSKGMRSSITENREQIDLLKAKHKKCSTKGIAAGGAGGGILGVVGANFDTIVGWFSK